jgi:molybdenum cofactor cytidylyltransferase
MTRGGHTVGCIVLAAGSGARFGSDKRMAAFGADTLLAHTLGTIAPEFHERILVLRSGDEALAKRFAGEWQVVFAADAGKGMGHSLAAAMERTGSWNGAVIALADMPYVLGSTFRALREALSADSIVVPHYHGERGNPVGIGRHYFTELAALQGDQGARALLRQHAAAIEVVEVEDPGILRDVDTPAALARAED